MTLLDEAKDTLKEACKTTFWLLKIMIPISIIVKILSEFGIITIIGEFLSPAMNVVGLPGDFGLVWATTMITNIYGGLVVFFNLSLLNSYTVAQVTILACMMLFAHTLPVEARIAQKAGVRLWFTLSLRIFMALVLGFILNIIFTTFHLFENENTLLWQPEITDPTLTQWILGELRNYLMIFLIILGLMTLMRILRKSGAMDRLNNFLKPGLRVLGMSKEVAPITIIGMTLGLAYGGGLIVKEAKSKILSKKDVFLSLSLMGLSHSLIEDTLLMVAIGASLVGVLFGRILFTIIVMFILIRIINRLSKKVFEKYFVNY
jgi:hypothetical protein